MKQHSRKRRLADFIAAIQAEGERASHWAERCGWIPGNGYCRRAARTECQDQCFFRWMRDEELAAIRRERLRRRLHRIYALAVFAIELACSCSLDLLAAT